MKSSIVVCHPFQNSFCHAVAQAAQSAALKAGEAVIRDLYAESVDPLLTGAEIARRTSLDPRIQEFSAEIQKTDLLITVHPDWWSSPPALLKGWIERVFRPGVAYDWLGEEFEEKRHVPLLTSLRLMAMVTTDKPEGGVPQAIELFWRDTCDYAGMHYVETRFFPDMRHSSHRRRREWLQDVSETIEELCAT